MQKLTYTRYGDYFIPDICLNTDNRPIGHWRQLHRDYIKYQRPVLYNQLCLSGKLWTYLADLNEQTLRRLEIIIEQMKAAEGVTKSLKSVNQMEWVQAMNSIRSRVEDTADVLSVFNVDVRTPVNAQFVGKFHL